MYHKKTEVHCNKLELLIVQNVTILDLSCHLVTYEVCNTPCAGRLECRVGIRYPSATSLHLQTFQISVRNRQAVVTIYVLLYFQCGCRACWFCMHADRYRVILILHLRRVWARLRYTVHDNTCHMKMQWPKQQRYCGSCRFFLDLSSKIDACLSDDGLWSNGHETCGLVSICLGNFAPVPSTNIEKS